MFQFAYSGRHPAAVVLIRTRKSFGGAAGIVPQSVATLPDAPGREPEEEIIDGQAAGSGDAQQGEAASSSSSTSVASRLRSLYKEQKGAVPRRYTVQGILSFLEMSSYLKPSVLGGVPGPGPGGQIGPDSGPPQTINLCYLSQINFKLT